MIATVLASSSVTFSPTNVPRTYPNVDIHFQTPAKLKAQTQYAIVLTSPSESFDNFVAWTYDAGSSMIDSNGTACADGAYAPGRAWGHDTFVPTPQADFFFYTFVIPTKQLTVSNSGAGAGTVIDSTGAINCGTTCTADFALGQTVQLTATPDPLSVFTGWVGTCSGTAPTCSFALTTDTSVTATFALKTYRLIVRKTGSGTVTSKPPGINCGKRCTALFRPGKLDLTAKAPAGWRFAHWQGACRGSTGRCRLNLTAPTATTATFLRKSTTK